MKRGVLFSVAASSLFGLSYFIAGSIDNLSETEVFGWRIVLNVAMVAAALIAIGQWRQVTQTLRAVQQRPLIGAGIVLCGLLMGSQLFLFMWAPRNGRGLPVALGYFLLPLVMVGVGYALYNERLSRLQSVALVAAIAGVGYELMSSANTSWELFFVALGFPLYFVVRKHLGFAHLGGLWLELVVSLPFALLFLAFGPTGITTAVTDPVLWLQIPTLAFVTSLALIMYIVASRNLSLSVFGLFGYLEPVMMFGVALLLGEVLNAGDLLTYVPILLAVMFLLGDGASQISAHRRLVHQPMRMPLPELAPIAESGPTGEVAALADAVTALTDQITEQIPAIAEHITGQISEIAGHATGQFPVISDSGPLLSLGQPEFEGT